MIQEREARWLFIWEGLFPVFFSSLNEQAFDIVYDDKELSALDLQDYDLIIVLLETTLGITQINDFTGFQIIKRLRTIDKVRVPIVASSVFMTSEIQVLGSGIDDHQIVGRPGHYFVPFLELYDFLEGFDGGHALSAEGLKDVVDSTYEKSGILRNIFHDYFGAGANERIERGFEILAPMVPPGFTEHFKEVCKKYVDSSIGLSEFKERIEELVLAERKNEQVKHKYTRPWSILYIDDSPRHLKVISSRFTKHGLVCRTASSGPKAFEILQADFEGRNNIANSISVVISDFRLLSDQELGTWQDFQGYDIINHIRFRLENEVAFFMLTNKSSAIMEKSRSRDFHNVQYFHKNDILSEQSTRGWETLLAAVINAGEANYQSLLHRPKIGGWLNGKKNTHIEIPISHLYRDHRLGAFAKWQREKDKQPEVIGYFELEKQVTEEALSIIEDAKMLQQEYEMNHRDDLNLQLNYKNLRPDFKESTIDFQEKFKRFLIGRRVALGLHFQSFGRSEIATLLKVGNYSKIDDRNVDKQVFDTFLCLGKHIFNSKENLLVEEVQFLKKYITESLDSNVFSGNY